jgi:hypothetical protein
MINWFILDVSIVKPASCASRLARSSSTVRTSSSVLEDADINEIFCWDVWNVYRVTGSALHVAVKHEHEAMVEFLLRRSAKQELLDGDRATVQALAVKKGNDTIVRLLQQHKPNDSQITL